jgi:hypothetical protein
MRKTPSGNPVPTVVVGTPEAAAPSSEAPQEVAEEATNRENEDATVEDATPPLEQPTTPKSAIIESAQLASPVAPTSVDAPSTPQSAMFEGISQPLSLLPPQESNPLIGSDSIEPSDSDDEPPAGGYYVVDKRPATAPPQTSTPQPTVEEFTVQDLIAPAPARPPRSSKHGRASLPPGATPVDLIAPSDSDDDAPSGGYVVYENKRPASNPNRGSPDLLARALQAAEGRTNSPKSLDLNRRRTLPTKRVSDFTARMRRAVLDA